MTETARKLAQRLRRIETRLSQIEDQLADERWELARKKVFELYKGKGDITIQPIQPKGTQ
tara:strand:- start:225 stop:404 length:180 start_codon:yes stop_codon:yes gene_type:complete